MKGEQASRRAGEQWGRSGAKARRRDVGADGNLPARSENGKRKTKDQSPKTKDHDCARAWQALRLAHDRVERQLTTELGQQCGLAISDFDVLLYLQLHDGEEIRMHDLTDAVLLSQPALSRLVARLVERDLLERSTAADDGRAIIVCLTAQGREVAARAVSTPPRSTIS
jgi:DNA-binding MarR family transcriptional regulator